MRVWTMFAAYRPGLFRSSKSPLMPKRSALYQRHTSPDKIMWEPSMSPLHVAADHRHVWVSGTALPRSSWEPGQPDHLRWHHWHQKCTWEAHVGLQQDGVQLHVVLVQQTEDVGVHAL